MSKAVYVAALGQVPIYEETQTTTNLSTSTIASFFTHNTGSGSTKWAMSNGSTGTIKLVPGNIGIDSTTASVTLTAATNLTNVRLNCSYTTETNYDKVTITAAGTTVASAVSGSGTKSWTGNMTKGQTIVLTYVKDVSQSASGEANTNVTITCNALVSTTQTLVGYEEKILAHKSKKLYQVIDGVTKKIQKGYLVRENFARRALPSGYTQVEYIEGSGTQYIDTGFVPDNNTRVVMDAQLTTSGSVAVWFGARTSATSNNYAFLRTSADDAFRSDYNNVYTQTWTADDSMRHVVDKNAETTTFAGTTQSYTNAAFQCPCNMTLFALNQTGTVQWYAAMKLYSCQIYDNGVLIRDYVPCIDADNEAGLYDMANNIFYGNDGTGTFVIGDTYKNITRLFYSSGVRFVSYSGAYTTSDVTVDGVACTLYTLTGSGTLVINGDGARVWMNGGGANGRKGSYTSTGPASAGAGGGGGQMLEGELASGTYTVQIGSAQGTTSFTHAKGDILSAAGTTSANGASGGGSGGWGTAGTGNGVSTYPFGLTSLYAHSAGGGGGTQYYQRVWSDGYTPETSYGGNGGSNGGNGSRGVSSSTTAKGGARGGGAGNGGNASFYGSGGGGGYASYRYDEETSGNPYYGHTLNDPGTGYQGVAYILIPA